MFNIKSFYKTKEWSDLLRVLKDQRSVDGVLYCEHCGKPIVKAYDCIGHHKVELTDSNVHDYNISLNPDNIMLVHHRCHNDIHERFGYVRTKQVYLVYGAPCAGKHTWVKDAAGKEDIILDIDNIWQMISINDRYTKPGRLKTNVFMIRDCILDMIRTRAGNWRNAYVIGGYPLAMDRLRLCETLGAEPIEITEDKDTCIERAKAINRPELIEYIEDWYMEYTE